MAVIIEDLRALSGSRRRGILAALRPAERRSVEALLAAAEGEGEPLPPQPSFLTELSPWLRERVEARLLPGTEDLTDRSRQALKDALQSLSPAGSDAGAARSNGSQRPLLEQLAERFRPRRPA